MRVAVKRRLVIAAAIVAGASAVGITTYASAETPDATGEQVVTASIEVDGVFDGENQRFIGGGALGDGGQDEGRTRCSSWPTAPRCRT